MAEAPSQAETAAKDKRIDELVLQAEKLVQDLNITVSDMRRILGIAAQRGQEAKDDQERRRGSPGGAPGG